LAVGPGVEEVAPAGRKPLWRGLIIGTLAIKTVLTCSAPTRLLRDACKGTSTMRVRIDVDFESYVDGDQEQRPAAACLCTALSRSSE